MLVETSQPEDERKKSFAEWLLVIGLAFALTYVFFAPLWTGGGLIGGDLYTYFLPQKQFFAERLAEGEFPLWNNRSGYGYPLVAESQTGAFYPPHLLLYSTLDVTTAYNLNQLLHYVATFILMWLYAREAGIRSGGAILAALIYTYGWFPPRLCLEWAIIGGMYLPLQLWLVERFLKTGRWRYPIWMSVAGGTQLLAGHFNLAFITNVVVVLYVPLRLWFAKQGVAESTLTSKPKTLGLTTAALALSFSLAAVQLVPTWELKQASQRKGDIEGGEFDAGYGHIPPLYLSQVFASWWWWYSPEIDRDTALNNLDTLAWPAETNQAEAHLYFGLIPLLLVVAAVASRNSREVMLNRFHVAWLILGLAALAYATGWLIPVLKYVPGFTFFRGPGRYGIVTTLGMAIAAGTSSDLILRDRSLTARLIVSVGLGILAGQGVAILLIPFLPMDPVFHPLGPRTLPIIALTVGTATGFGAYHLQDQKSSRIQLLLVAAVVTVTALEFYGISRHVTYAFQLEQTPIQILESSPVRTALLESEEPVRLHAPGPNLTNLIGVSSVPEYLGLGPAEYYDEELKPRPLDLAKDPATSREFAHWASRHGITHVLSFDLLPKTTDWRLVSAQPDPFLNFAWARGNEPIYLYRRTAPAWRALFEHDGIQSQVEISRYRANEVEIKVDSTKPGLVILRDLMFPGWEVTVDGRPAEALRHERLFRAVKVSAGPHTVVWTYRPASLKIGIWISGAAILVLLAAGHVRFWHFRPKPSSTIPENSS